MIAWTSWAGPALSSDEERAELEEARRLRKSTKGLEEGIAG